MMMLMDDGNAVDVAYTALDAGAVVGWVAAHDSLDTPMAALEEGEELSLPHYSQRCLAWRDIALGYSSSETLGTAGCAVTAAASILSQVDRTIIPETLNGLLQDGADSGTGT